jgi:hypothetical protein
MKVILLRLTIATTDGVTEDELRQAILDRILPLGSASVAGGVIHFGVTEIGRLMPHTGQPHTKEHRDAIRRAKTANGGQRKAPMT